MCVFVFVETKDHELTETTCEVVSEARRLASTLSLELHCVLVEGTAKKTIGEIAGYGPDKILLLEAAALTPYAPETWTHCLCELCREFHPDAFIFAATVRGDDLARRVAAKLRVGLVPDVDRFQVDKDGRLIMTRLCHEQKVHQTLKCSNVRPQMATVAPGVMKIKKDRTAPQPEIVPVDAQKYLPMPNNRVTITGFIKADPKNIDITDAELIVAGGKGAGDNEGFQLIRDVAEALNASIAGSRVAMDCGFIDRSRQIGQSGKTVSPDLIISCGISGASAHTIGMRDSKTVIAINTDKNAKMIKMADLGVVGDLRDILPILTQKIKTHLNTHKPSE